MVRRASKFAAGYEQFVRRSGHLAGGDGSDEDPGGFCPRVTGEIRRQPQASSGEGRGARCWRRDAEVKGRATEADQSDRTRERRRDDERQVEVQSLQRVPVYSTTAPRRFGGPGTATALETIELEPVLAGSATRRPLGGAVRAGAPPTRWTGSEASSARAEKSRALSPGRRAPRRAGARCLGGVARLRIAGSVLEGELAGIYRALLGVAASMPT